MFKSRIVLVCFLILPVSAYCQTCDGEGNCIVCDGDPNKECCNGECCDHDNCETCIDGECKVCGGNPDQKCCPDKSCVQKCKVVDGEDCDKLSTFDDGCAINDTDCSYLPTARLYKGGIEKICDPTGCPGDCTDDTKVCYTDYPYIKSPVPFICEECSSMTAPPPPQIPQLCNPPCCISTFPFPTLCYKCIFDNENKEEHLVQNDSCE